MKERWSPSPTLTHATGPSMRKKASRQQTPAKMIPITQFPAVCTQQECVSAKASAVPQQGMKTSHVDANGVNDRRTSGCDNHCVGPRISISQQKKAPSAISGKVLQIWYLTKTRKSPIAPLQIYQIFATRYITITDFFSLVQRPYQFLLR